MKTWSPTRRLIAAALTITGIAGLAIIAFDYYARPYNGPQLNLEYVKAVLQLLLAAVVVGAVRIIADNYQRQKGKEDQRQKAKEEVLRDLVAAYSNVKQARRLLRARGLSANGDVRTNIYDERLEYLSAQRLSIEAIAERVEASRKVFVDRKGIGDRITSMEKYLNSLTKEWEEKLPAATRDGVIDGDRLPQLLAFLQGATAPDGTSYPRHFVEPYHLALQSLRMEIERGGAAPPSDRDSADAAP
ncbi:MAG: hypothetical protein JNM66_17880 [Bryobacterales bacterium]|nr:hypothetical protein [Bryobacterales bacterium]